MNWNPFRERCPQFATLWQRCRLAFAVGSLGWACSSGEVSAGPLRSPARIDTEASARALLHRAGVSGKPAPVLAIVQIEDRVVLSWPSSATGFFLYSKHGLEDPVWERVTAPVTEVDGQFVVSLLTLESSRFYALEPEG